MSARPIALPSAPSYTAVINNDRNRIVKNLVSAAVKGALSTLSVGGLGYYTYNRNPRKSMPKAKTYRRRRVSHKGVPYTKKYIKRKPRVGKRNVTTTKRIKRHARRRRPNLRQEVAQIKKELKHDLSTYHHRVADTNSLGASANQCGYFNWNTFNFQELRLVMDKFRYFDPSNPGTLITAVDLAAGGFHRNILLKKTYSKIRIKNNYIAPAKVTLYLCKVKADSNLSPLDAFEDGMATQAIGFTSSNPLYYLTDSSSFGKMYQIVQTKTKVLMGGQSLTNNATSDNITIDENWFDIHPELYQKQLKQHIWLVRVEGTLAHNEAAGVYQVGKQNARVDIELYSKYEFQYDSGGVSLNDLGAEGNWDTFSSAAVVSMKKTDNEVLQVS